MRCPADVEREEFRKLLSEAPRGAKLVKTYRGRSPFDGRRSDFRRFTFLLKKPHRGYPRGSHYEMSLICKFEALEF